MRVGNPYYMAPEQFNQGLKASNHRSDLWSFAAVAYKLITDQAVFSQGHQEIREARFHPIHYRPIRELAANTPEKFSRFIESCLHEDPEKRYANASVLLGDMLKEINQLYQFIQQQKK